MADGSLIFDTKVDTKGFKQGSNTLKSQAEGLGGTFKKLAGAIAGAFLIKKSFDLGKQAVSLASDVQEVQNVVDTAFGDMAYKIEDFSKTSIQNFGLSQLAAKKTASTYMAMAKGMQLPADVASDMSVKLTGLTGDMSSFYNVSQDVADTALKSIFTGETESLKQFGVVMTQTNLQQFAYSQGINQSIDTMSQAQLVQLRYNYVLQQTSLAQGDFAKTSGSWANQTRVLQEQWKQFLTLLGTGLLKVLTPVIRALNGMMSQLISFATAASSMLSGLFGEDSPVSSGQKQITSEINSSVSATEDLAGAQKALGKAVKGNLAGFDELNVLSSGSSDGGAGVAGVSVAPIIDSKSNESEAKKSASKMQTQFKAMADKVASYFKKTFGAAMVSWGNSLKSIFTDVFGSLKLVATSLWDDYFYPAIMNFITIGVPILVEYVTQTLAVWQLLVSEFTSLFNQIWQEGVVPILQELAKINTDIWLIIQDAWDRYGTPIFDGIKTAIQNTADILRTVWESVLKPIFDVIMQTIDWLWEKHLKALVANIVSFVGELAVCALAIYNSFISPLVKWLVQVLGPIFVRVFGGIIGVAGTLLGGISDVAGGIITTLKGIIQFVTGVFEGDWWKAWNGIKNIFKGIWDALVGIIKVPINLIIGLVNGMVSAVISGLNFVINAVNKMSFDVPDWVPGIGGNHFGFDLKTINAANYKIPKLATGAVIPPNSEFLAVLGDQKRGMNIETPLDTMVQAFKSAIAEMGGVGGGNPRVDVYLDGVKLSRELYPYMSKESSRKGESLVTVV